VRRFLFLFLAVVMTLVVALPAGADKPNCKTNPDHPSCHTTPTPEPPAVQPCEPGVTTLSGNGWLEFECDWTPKETDIPATGMVTVTKIGPSGEVSHVVIAVRDSAPGDICGWVTFDKPDGDVFEASFPLSDARGTYWGYTNPLDTNEPPTEYVGEHWCERYDPIAGPRTDLNGEPLSVVVNARVKKGTVIQISLTPDQEP
jgi:hypothetical protein